MKDVLVALIREYHRVESQFQHGSIDKCVIAMREKRKGNIRSVVEDVLSHASVVKKNALVVQLIVSRALCTFKLKNLMWLTCYRTAFPVMITRLLKRCLHSWNR